MTTVVLRQSQGGNIVNIPKKVAELIGLHVGSKLELSVENNKIVLTPIEDELTLEALLAGSPKEAFRLTDEDREWMEEGPVGKEI